MMFPAGSRLLIGATVLTALAATLYGVTVGGSLGTMGLISAAVALGVLTVINLYTRDADVSALDEIALTDSPAAHRAPSSSLWPMVGAVGAVLLVVGLVTYPVVFMFGIVALIAAVVEWMLQAWSERASGDRAYNTEVRERFAHPAEFPVLAALGFGVIVYSFSRIMLSLSKTGGPVAFGTIAALVLGAGFLVAFRRNLGNAVVAGVAAVAVLALVAGGIAAALSGEREIDAHETIDDLAAEGACTDEEVEGDENAGRSVADKANLFAEVILREDDTLVATETGVEGEQETLTFQRANPANVLFVNESDEERRLVLEFGELEVTDEVTGEEETLALMECTPLVGEGGSQLMTVTIGRSSLAYGPYQFVVPGVDGQSIEVVVRDAVR